MVFRHRRQEKIRFYVTEHYAYLLLSNAGLPNNKDSGSRGASKGEHPAEQRLISVEPELKTLSAFHDLA